MKQKIFYDDQEKFHIIYKTTCLINNKYYVGMHSTVNLEDGYIGSGKRLWYSIKKYGKENFTFEILEYHSNREELAKREKELVNEEILKDLLCLNLKPGGTGGFSKEVAKNGRKKTDEILTEKYGENFRSVINKRFRSNMTEEQKKEHYRKTREGQTKVGFQFNIFSGKNHSEKTKKKLSDLKKGTGIGSNNSQFGSCWITNEIENKKIKKGDLIPDGWRLGRKIKKR